jgi:hypothetical protein
MAFSPLKALHNGGDRNIARVRKIKNSAGEQDFLFSVNLVTPLDGQKRV